MVTETEPTLLEIFGARLPPYASRGASQTIEPISESAHLERASDGSLINLSYEPFHKYKTTISCTDQQAPAWDGVWAGQIVVIHSVQELAFDEYASGPNRPEVPGSLREANGFKFYRPILTCMVKNYTMQTNEYSASVQWQLEAEEI